MPAILHRGSDGVLRSFRRRFRGTPAGACRPGMPAARVPFLAPSRAWELRRTSLWNSVGWGLLIQVPAGAVRSCGQYRAGRACSLPDGARGRRPPGVARGVDSRFSVRPFFAITSCLAFTTRDRIRTCNLRFRRPMLYPIELLARVRRGGHAAAGARGRRAYCAPPGRCLSMIVRPWCPPWGISRPTAILVAARAAADKLCQRA